MKNNIKVTAIAFLMMDGQPNTYFCLVSASFKRLGYGCVWNRIANVIYRPFGIKYVKWEKKRLLQRDSFLPNSLCQNCGTLLLQSWARLLFASPSREKGINLIGQTLRHVLGQV